MAGLGLLCGCGFGPSPGNHRCLCSSPTTCLFPRVCWARFPWVQQLRHVHLWVLAKRSSCLCRDISPLLKDPVAFRALIDLLEDHLRTSLPPIDFIAGGCSPGQSTVCRCCPGAARVVGVGRRLPEGPGDIGALGCHPNYSL